VRREPDGWVIVDSAGSRHGSRLEACRKLAAISPDPSTKVGAIIYGRSGDAVGYGWNSFPANSIADEAYYQNRELKYDRIIHAEMRCLQRASWTQAWGGTLYTSMAPCKDCAKHICDAMVSRVYYPSGVGLDQRRHAAVR
jgi:dCMP deaminase